MSRIKKLLYISVLKMILGDGEDIYLTGKQKCQINALIWKLENI